MKYNELTPDEERVVLRKGTERAFTGEFTNNKESDTYKCRNAFFLRVYMYQRGNYSIPNL
jgi:peptide methionine sulfoxide reductase MsrB